MLIIHRCSKAEEVGEEGSLSIVVIEDEPQSGHQICHFVVKQGSPAGKGLPMYQKLCARQGSPGSNICRIYICMSIIYICGAHPQSRWGSPTSCIQ